MNLRNTLIIIAAVLAVLALVFPNHYLLAVAVLLIALAQIT